ncbi:MAG: ABC transporter permease [Halolamina sp.]
MNDTGGETGDPATFEQVEWEAIEATGRIAQPSTVLFLVLLAGLVPAFLYHFFFVLPAHTLYGPIDPSPLTWLVLFALAFLLSYGVLPLALSPSRALEFWEAFRARRFGRLSFGVLTVLGVVAVAGPEILGLPISAKLPFTEGAARQPSSGLPPFGLSVPVESLIYCSGETHGDRCFGMAAHPLGTTSSGRDVLAFVVGGFRVAFEVATLTAVILVPVATVAGTVAAFTGGRVDAVITRSADFFQVLPAFVIYLFVRMIAGPELWVLVVLFGLLGWGHVARRVRAEALSLRDAGYVRAAADAGSTPADTVLRHLIPNVSHVAVGSLASQIPKLLVVEITLSYLGFVQTKTPSWGYAIVSALKNPNLPATGIGVVSPLRLWWAIVFPVLALLLMVSTTTVLVDALGDALDPEGEP